MGSSSNSSRAIPAATAEECTDDNDGEGDNSSSSLPAPLHHSSRLKGYITLFVSSLYNFIATSEKLEMTKGEKVADSWNGLLCTVDDFGQLLDQQLLDQRVGNQGRLRLAFACSTLTMIFTCAIILCHLDFCTPLRKNVWPKWFGGNGKIELCTLLLYSLLWFIATWFTTSIRGPAGDGMEQYNLYFSSWICCWASVWTLERWCTASGRASFEKFVRSWPNRCPLWIVTLLLSLADFMFALDAVRHWEEGTVYSPFTYKLYSEVSNAEWTLLLFVTGATSILSLVWVLAEIFRESRTNVDSVKSATETFVEGLTLHVITVTWVVTVCIVTRPGGSASLLGNLYYTSWATLFAIIGTLMWWVRDWRQGILNVILEQQNEYDQVKQNIRMREEIRLARLAEEAKEKKQGDDRSGLRSTESNAEESKTTEDDGSKIEEYDNGVLCEDDPVEDDITISITSGEANMLSRAGASPDGLSLTDSHSGVLAASRNWFASALSGFYQDTDGEQSSQAEDNH